MKKSNKMIFGIMAGVASGMIISRLIRSEKGSQIFGDLNMQSKNILDNFKSKYSKLSANIYEKITGHSKNAEEKFRDSHLERTRSTASQFNSH